VKGVEHEIVKRRQQSEELRLEPMNEGPTPSADRTIANANMIKVGIDFKAHATAMAGALIGRHHGP